MADRKMMAGQQADIPILYVDISPLRDGSLYAMAVSPSANSATSAAPTVAPTVTVNTTGTTTTKYAYLWTYATGDTGLSPLRTVANGATPPNNSGTVPASPVGVLSTKVLRTVGGATQGVIATLAPGVTAWTDVGVVATAYSAPILVPVGAQLISAGAATLAADWVFFTGQAGNVTGTPLPCAGMAQALIEVVGNPSGGTVVSFLAAGPSGTFYPCLAYNVNGTGIGVTSTATPGLYIVPVGGRRQLRCDITGYAAGAGIGATATLSPLADPVFQDAVTLATGITRTLDSIDSAHYGTPSVTTVAVTTASTAVLAANAARGGLMLSNVGANNIYVNLSGGTALITNLLLIPNQMVSIREGTVPTSAITAIAVTGTTNLSVTEFPQ